MYLFRLYNLKMDPSSKRFGFIAQDIETTFTEKLGLHFKDPENILPQAVCYTELIAPMVQIINDLLLRVSELEKKVG